MPIELLSERLEVRLSKTDKKIIKKLKTKLTTNKRISDAEILRIGLEDLAHKHNIETSC